MEDLHLAAFRQSDLANSVVAAPHLAGQLGTDQLASHLSRTLLAGRTAICGTGIDHESLVQYAQGLQLAEGDGEICERAELHPILFDELSTFAFL